ncbi:amidohydrolase family protein [Mesorhizobium sp. BR1-1-16]|uniref:amidohydrolase family protein n=1 Tax=Mesorhizobium sp. BR1-1-16 TaxID=2876653 RepID=UPI001CCB0081|nr:amidohydrolase family protein [Mesorhizobium sp. BR1-1-16]MBZ9939281.1 amidohydrolase family protein [Mesorhizobium sp. BR1-1-16]
MRASPADSEVDGAPDGLYRGPIIDTHHHLWDLSMNRHPWLMQSSGPLAALSSVASTYLVEDFLEDSAGQNVVATVHIEALWAGDPAEETRWLDALEKGGGVGLRYVANARLGTPDTAKLIAAQAASPRVAGIRAILSCHPDPEKSFVGDPRLAYAPDFRRDVGRVRDHGLHLELMMYPYQAEAVADLAAAFPDLSIVINHCGSPIDRDAAGMKRWHDAIVTVASAPNTIIKISSPGAYDAGWTLDSIRELVAHCLASFGPDRAMFGTDAPVCRLTMSVAEIWNALRQAVRHLPASQQAALFFDNAQHIYRLDEVRAP